MGNNSEPKKNISGFANELSELISKSGDNSEELIASCLELITRIAETSIESDWSSLNDICLLFQERLNAIVEKGEQLNAKQLEALKSWPSLVLDLVNSTSTQETGSALVNHLNNPCWNSRLSDMDVEILKTMLSIPVAGEETASSEPEVKQTSKAPVITAGTDGKLPEAVRELVELLTAGLNDFENLLKSTFEKVAVKNIKHEEKTALLETLAQQLASYAEAASSIGFKALEQICAHVQTNILQLVEQDITPEISRLFDEWLTQVRDYLNVVTDADTAANLAVFMVDDSWPLPFPIEQAEALSMQLVSPEIPELEAEAPKRKQQASDEDVSLELPDDVDQDLLEALLQELPGQTEEFSTAIQNLINGGTLEDINVAQRVAHTLKGAGNTVGIRGMANIAHNLEDILLALAKHQTLPPEPLIEMMQNASDCLEAMSEGLAGLGELPDNAREVLQDILDWANQIDRDGIPADAKAPAREQAETEKTTGKTETPSDKSSTKKDNGKAPVPMIRIPATLVDELLRLEGEEVIFSGQIQERLRRITGQSRDIQDQYLRLQELGGKLEELIDVKDMSTVGNQLMKNAAEFDALEMDQYSELHTCTRLLVETATDIHEMGKSVMSQLTSLEEMVVGQERLNRESQEVALRTRMVPVDTIFSRLQRAVRQTCNATKKKVDLKLQGGETLVASDILNDLVDPLMHIVRNAIDHGIENAELREQRNKPEQGVINLEFLREGNQIVVKVQDDGGGLDLEGIKRTARERGILESEDITDTQLIKFILRPNFSTRTETTQVSGRGIGMDAVNTRIIELGGTLTLNTEEGKGCLVEFSLPVSLISMHALLVRLGRNIISIANRGIEQILHADDGKVTQNGEGQLFQVGETKYPLKLLEVLLNIHDRRSRDRNPRPVILVKTQDGITAVMVESVVDSRDVVVKGLGQYIPKLHGIMGATILGDGSVTPVMDLPELLRDPVKRPQGPDELNATSEFILNQPLALVVDDSLSARRSLMQFMEDSGFEVRAARDGIEAIEILEGRKPNIMLVDMEMPRMNGIELTAHVRSHDRTRDIPIIMITSRSTAKHRQEAESAGVNSHITKPFNEEELLEEVERIRLRD